MAKTPILDLNTLIDRPKVRIDGVIHEMRAPEELSILDSQQLTVWGREIDALAGQEGREAELAAVVDQVARKVLVDVPPSVLDRLSDQHKLSVVQVFTGLLLRRKMATAGALAASLIETDMSRSTGAKSSPLSSASTAAILAGGSPAPRQPS